MYISKDLINGKDYRNEGRRVMCEILCDIEECESNTEGTCCNQSSIHIEEIDSARNLGGVCHYKKSKTPSKDKVCPSCGISLEEED